VGGGHNFAEYKDMLEHAGFTGIVDTNLVDLKIQPVKASKCPYAVYLRCGNFELRRAGGPSSEGNREESVEQINDGRD
jgi:hypothetical protein